MAETFKATKQSLGNMFHSKLVYRIPFFQRGYVWTESNWDTLFENLLDVFESELNGNSKEHFLGTVVTKDDSSATEHQCYLVDGQQRLTTIQILSKAIYDRAKGNEDLSTFIAENIWHKDSYGKRHFKVSHSKVDKSHFEGVLSAQGLADEHTSSENRLFKAYSFFTKKLEAFTEEDCRVLNKVLMHDMPVISMSLSADADEQMIFDTINSLGVKLTTAELLKNHLFQDEGLHPLYDTTWFPVFEENESVISFWEENRSAGRVKRTNLEMLLYCYLVINRSDADIKIENLFSEYKKWIKTMSLDEKKTFLNELVEYAELYQSFPDDAELNQISFNQHRHRLFHVIEQLSISTALPLILYLYKRVSDVQTLTAILRVLESYLVRRTVCKLTTKNYNKMFVSVLNRLTKLDAISEEGFGKILRSWDDQSNLYPTDEHFKSEFLTAKLYNKIAREILFCIALKQAAHVYSEDHTLSSNSLSLEHVMPKKWRNNWEADLTPEQEQQRDRTLLTLGNLTLLTKRLNSKLRDSEWDKKRAALKEYSSLKMTTDYLLEDTWDEALIERRGEVLAEVALEIWR